MSELRLYPYQSAGVSFIKRRTKSLIADPPGLGKTAQAICGTSDFEKIMVICPASLKRNWVDEFEIWRSDISAQAMFGRKSFRWPQSGEALIFNYDILPRHGLEMADGEGVALIIDEVHACKNPDSIRSMCVMDLVDCVIPHGKLVTLTGTPLLNRPSELGAILMVTRMMEETWGSMTTFMRHFICIDGRWHIEKSLYPTISKIMLRREREDVLPQLPPKRWQTIMVDPKFSASQLKLLGEANSKLDLYLDVQGAIRTGTCPLMFELATVRRLLAERKIPFAMDIADSFDGVPLVAFSDHKLPVERLGGRKHWAYSNGSVANGERVRRIKAFQGGDIDGLGLTIMAHKEGLNLERASNMLIVDPNWVAAYNTQAEDRIYRMTQKNACSYIYLVVDHPLDRRMFELCHDKDELFASAIQDKDFV